MRIPTFGALTLAAAAAVVALPTTANAVAPAAVADSFQTEAGAAKTINVLTNDNADAGNAGRSLTVTGKTDGAHGNVTCAADGACTYTPLAGFSGTDSFTYNVADSSNVNEFNTGTVTVKVVKIMLISISSSPAAITYSYNTDTGALAGRAAKVTGIVRQSSTVVLPDVQVELWHKPFGAATFTKLAGPFTSDADGTVSYQDIKRTSKTYYQWKSVTKTSAAKSVAVTPTVTATFSPSKTQAVGQPFTVSGKSEPATGGAQVLLQSRGTTGAWETAGTTTLNSDSTYAFPSITPTTSVSKLYRVVVPANNGREQVTTGQNTVQAYSADLRNVETANSDEYVSVKNDGVVSINLKDWTLSQGTTTVTLPRRFVDAGTTVRIHSGKGVNTAKDLYLRRADDTVWPRTGTVTLRDDHAVQMDRFTF